MDELSVEYIDVYYFSSEAAGEDDEVFSDIEPVSDLEETENGYKVRYDKKEQLETLKKCIRPSQLVNGWTIWNADVTMEVVLEGQESTDGDSGLYMTFAGEIPDFIRADAGVRKANHIAVFLSSVIHTIFAVAVGRRIALPSIVIILVFLHQRTSRYKPIISRIIRSLILTAPTSTSILNTSSPIYAHT